MKRPVIVALASVVAILATSAQDAIACGRKSPVSAFWMDETWKEDFAERFSAASGVYLVTVGSEGLLLEDGRPWSMRCDSYDVGPPPPGKGASRSAKAAYAKTMREIDASRNACSAHRVRVRVIETIKGATREGWLEDQSFIQVTEGAPPEPWQVGDTQVYYALLQGPAGAFCDGRIYARRMSPQSQYVVFTYGTGESAMSRLHIGHAFLADASTPFLAEARRLADEGR